VTSREPLISCLLAVVIVAIAPAICSAEVETGSAYAYKIAVERHLESRLNNALKKVTKIDNLVVFVNAEVLTLEQAPVQFKASRKPSESRPLMLPGVPARENLSVDQKEDQITIAAPLPVVIQSMLVTVLVDTTLSQNTIDTIHNVTLTVLDFEPDRGDRIEIRKVDFLRGGYNWESLLYPPGVFILLFGIVGALFLTAASVFFLSPFRSLTRVLSVINWKDLRGDDSLRGVSHAPVPSAPEALTPPIHRQEDTSAGADGAADHGRFGCVTSQNISETGFLLQESQAEDIAQVLGFIGPHLASQLLGMFPVEKQAEAVSLLSITRKLDPEKLDKLEESIKGQLGYIVGGEDRLAAILDLADDDVRDRTITDIERKDFNTAISIREKVKSFESIIRKLENNDLQKLIRRLDPAIFARILNSSPGDVQAKALESLSGGGAERLQEEMKYGGTFPPDRLKREKRGVIAIYRELLEAGEIQERDSGGMGI